MTPDQAKAMRYSTALMTILPTVVAVHEGELEPVALAGVRAKIARALLDKDDTLDMVTVALRDIIEYAKRGEGDGRFGLIRIKARALATLEAGGGSATSAIDFDATVTSTRTPGTIRWKPGPERRLPKTRDTPEET